MWKGRCFGRYDPHGNEPAGWAARDEILKFVQGKRAGGRLLRAMFSEEYLADPATHPIHYARIAFRDVARSSEPRTVVACLIPPMTPLTHVAPYLIFAEGWPALARASVLGVMNSIPFDWQARRYVETNLTYFILNMLCFPRWEDADWRRIGGLAARLSCADGRFEAFAEEAGVECGPLGEEEREAMRAEIDALTARGYGLGADELRFVFGDFTEQAATPRYRERVMAAFEGLA